MKAEKVYGYNNMPSYASTNPEALHAAWKAYSPIIPPALYKAGLVNFIQVCEHVIKDEWVPTPWSQLSFLVQKRAVLELRQTEEVVEVDIEEVNVEDLDAESDLNIRQPTL